MLARIARAAFVVLLVVSGPTASLATAGAPASAARPATSQTVSTATSNMPAAGLAVPAALPAQQGAGAPARPGAHARMDLLQQLLSTPHGRALLKGGLGARQLNALERVYGTKTHAAAHAAARPSARPRGAASARRGATRRTTPATVKSGSGRRAASPSVIHRSSPTLVLSTHPLRAGGIVRLTGRGFRPGQALTFSLVSGARRRRAARARPRRDGQRRRHRAPARRHTGRGAERPGAPGRARRGGRTGVRCRTDAAGRPRRQPH